MPGPPHDDDPDERPPRVIVVDDHVRFRALTRRALEAAGLHVVGEAGNGAAVAGVVEAARPDVVLMDLAMPGMGGVEATRRVREAAPEVRVLVVTTSTEDADLLAALRAGAAGYVLKEAGDDDLVAAVRATLRGETSLSPAMAARLAAHVRADARRPRAPAPPIALGERELELLRHIARGDDNAGIASALHLSPHTVKGAVSALLARLGVSNRVQAAVWAVEHGLDGAT